MASDTSAVDTYHGEAMSIGERTPVALLKSCSVGTFLARSGRSLTDIAGTNIGYIKRSLRSERRIDVGHPSG